MIPTYDNILCALMEKAYSEASLDSVYALASFIAIDKEHLDLTPKQMTSYDIMRDLEQMHNSDKPLSSGNPADDLRAAREKFSSVFNLYKHQQEIHSEVEKPSTPFPEPTEKPAKRPTRLSRMAITDLINSRLENPMKLSTLSVQAIADACGCSTTTITNVVSRMNNCGLIRGSRIPSAINPGTASINGKANYVVPSKYL